MSNSNRAKVPSFLKGKLVGHVQTQTPEKTKRVKALIENSSLHCNKTTLTAVNAHAFII